MTNLTYEAYLRNPNAREAIEDEVRRLRNEAVDRYIVEPAHDAVRRVVNRLRHAAPRARTSPRPSVSSAA